MDITNGIIPITKSDKLLDDEYKEIETLEFLEYKKITVQKRTIKDKTYTSYLLGIPHYAITTAINNFFGYTDDKIEGYTVLNKIDNQTYELLITDELKPGIIKLENIEYYDTEKRIYQTTLPKKQIEYLQAYDKYLETIEYINNKYNKEFEAKEITAHITIFIAPTNDMKLEKKVIIQFYTFINDKLEHSIELLNDEKPRWFKILTDPIESIPHIYY